MSSTTPKDEEPKEFPYRQLTVLAICRFSEPIAFNSILSYSFVMTQDLLGSGDESDASFYSGLLVSAYAVAEAVTAVGWGTLSDHYGRKPVVLFGLGGVAISSLIFGFAKSYWVALLARLIGGALNGNVSVMQTMVAEMVKHPEHEPAAYAVQPFVWTLGGIFGSALGGFLAQPAHYYPNLFPQDGLFGRYPYLLPNLTSVFVIIVAIIQGMIFLEETNPAARRAEQKKGLAEERRTTERTPLLRERERARTPSVQRSIRSSVDGPRPVFAEESLPVPGTQTFDLRRSSFGTMHSIEIQPGTDQHRGRPALPTPIAEDPPSLSAVVSHDDTADDPPAYELTYNGPVWTRTIIMLIIALVFISYHQMAAGALLPIHLLDKPHQPRGHLDLVGGFGYSLHDVSVYLMVNGILSLFVQAFLFPIFLARVGVWHSFLSTVAAYPTAYLLMPFLSAVPRLTDPGIYLSLILQAFFGIVSVPAILILLKDATPSPLVLGRVNGLAMSACCAARTVSPPVVGLLYSAGGSAVAWLSCAAVGVLGAIQLFWVPRKSAPAVAFVKPDFGPAGDRDDEANEA